MVVGGRFVIEAPFVATCQALQAGDLYALVEVSLSFSAMTICPGLYLKTLMCHYCVLWHLSSVRSDCEIWGCKSQAGAICCLSASLSLLTTSQLVTRWLPAGRACCWGRGWRELAQGWWLVCSAPSVLYLLAVSCVRLLHMCLESMALIVIEVIQKEFFL